MPRASSVQTFRSGGLFFAAISLGSVAIGAPLGARDGSMDGRPGSTKAVVLLAVTGRGNRVCVYRIRPLGAPRDKSSHGCSVSLDTPAAREESRSRPRQKPRAALVPLDMNGTAG
ncbi:MAG: hypothetical protein QOE58_586 [Actinomycetota bacterium]|nr:hypothetical protein [Actinomycetota bacterium]